MTDWQQDAACAPGRTGLPADAWFPAKTKLTEENWDALRVCETCLVREQCHTYKREHYIHDGIWGGKSPVPQHVPPETRDKAIVLTLAGQTTTSVAEVTGLHESTIRRILRKAGMSRTTIAEAQRAARDKEIVARVEAGEPTADVAADMGMSHTNLYRVLRREGATTPRYRHTSDTVTAVERLLAYDPNIVLNEAADALGMNVYALRRALDRGNRLDLRDRLLPTKKERTA